MVVGAIKHALESVDFPKYHCRSSFVFSRVICIFMSSQALQKWLYGSSANAVRTLLDLRSPQVCGELAPGRNAEVSAACALGRFGSAARKAATPFVRYGNRERVLAGGDFHASRLLMTLTGDFERRLARLTSKCSLTDEESQSVCFFRQQASRAYLREENLLTFDKHPRYAQLNRILSDVCDALPFRPLIVRLIRGVPRSFFCAASPDLLTSLESTAQQLAALGEDPTSIRSELRALRMEEGSSFSKRKSTISAQTVTTGRFIQAYGHDWPRDLRGIDSELELVAQVFRVATDFTRHDRWFVTTLYQAECWTDENLSEVLGEREAAYRRLMMLSNRLFQVCDREDLCEPIIDREPMPVATPKGLLLQLERELALGCRKKVEGNN